MINSLSNQQKSELRFKYLSAAVDYKLAKYAKASEEYQKILDENMEDIDSHDKSDIVVNYLAC